MPGRTSPAPLNFIISGGNPRLMRARYPQGAPGRPKGRRTVQDHRGRRGGGPAGDTHPAGPGKRDRYREMLYIATPGRKEKPIVFDGSGETVTGFDPLRIRKEDGKWVCDLKPILSGLKGVQGFALQDGNVKKNDTFPKALPTVLTYRGERLVLDAKKQGQFTKYAKLSDDGGKLILEDGISPEGWEIAVRPHVVRVSYVSTSCTEPARLRQPHRWLQLTGRGATWSLRISKAFTIWMWVSRGMIQIHCHIDKARFWGNENGLYGSQEELTASDVDSTTTWDMDMASRGRARHSPTQGVGQWHVPDRANPQGRPFMRTWTVYDQMPPERVADVQDRASRRSPRSAG